MKWREINRQYAACQDADDFYEMTAFEILKVEKVSLGVFVDCFMEYGKKTGRF